VPKFQHHRSFEFFTLKYVCSDIPHKIDNDIAHSHSHHVFVSKHFSCNTRLSHCYGMADGNDAKKCTESVIDESIHEIKKRVPT
jgi:hypothetical protein